MSEGYIDKDWCSFESYRRQRLFIYLLTFVGVASYTSMAGYFNTGAIQLLSDLISSVSPRFNVNLWVPAIVEEIFLRLIPGIFILVIYEWIVSNRCYRIPDEAFRLGAVGAFAMGIVELYIRIMLPSGIWMIDVWNHPDYTVALLAPFVMHMFAATVNLGVFFRVFGDFDIESRDIVAYLGALLIGIAIHFVFNTWVQNQWAFWREWIRTFGTPVTLLVLLVLAIIGADVLDEYVKNREART
jgi:hypothetical protein